MSKNSLYYIATPDKSLPFLLDKHVALLYDNKEKAETAALNLSRKYYLCQLKVILADNIEVFFQNMANMGVTSFLLNGNSRIMGAQDFLKDIALKNDSFLNVIGHVLESQPKIRTIVQSPRIPSAKGSNGRKILKRIVIGYLIACILCAIFFSDSSEVKYKMVEDSRIEDYIDDDINTYKIVTDDYKKYINDLNKEYFVLNEYSEDIPYTKGNFNNGVYRSDFALLNGIIPMGYERLSDSELNGLLTCDTHTLDWEFGAKSVSGNYVTALFTIDIGEYLTHVECINILKNLSPGYTFVGASGVGMFIAEEIGVGYMPATRVYNIVKFTDDSGITRQFWVNKVNNRLVCVIRQWHPGAGNEMEHVFDEEW